MMSIKRTFSLTILITILALAFTTAPAMAAEFGGSMSVMDVSFADGNQVELPADLTTATTPDTALMIDLKFDKQVMQDKIVANIEARLENKFGGQLSLVDIDPTDGDQFFTVAEKNVGTEASPVMDGKNFTLMFGFPGITTPTDSTTPYKLKVRVKKGLVDAAVGGADTSKDIDIEIMFVGPEADDFESMPMPVSIMLANNLRVPASGFTGDKFDIIVTLTEQPKEGKFTKDHLDVAEGTAADGVFLGTAPQPADATDAAETPALATGRDMMYYQYLVTITPAAKDANLVIKLKSFEDQNKPTPNKYTPETNDAARVEMVDKLTVKIKRATTTPKVAGVKFGLPKDKVIPAGGYLVVAEDKGGSSVHVPPGDIDKSPMDHERTPAERMYNVIDDGDLPNIEAFLANGGTIGVMGPHALMISEIMWGSDASLDDPGKSQWIELYNAGAEYKTQDGTNTTYLVFYDGPTAPATGLHDTVGTVDATQGYWSIAGKGQSGRSGKGEKPADFGPIGTTSPIISMTRVMDTAGALAKGTLASSWVQSVPPSSNFEVNAPGVHIGSPGAMPTTFPEPPAPTPEPVVVPPTPVAMPADIMITEIMVDTGDGRLPQWIELNNVSGAEKSLAGWSLEIENAAADADAIGRKVSIDLMGTLGVSAHTGNTGQGQSLLLVSWEHRSSSNLQGNTRIVDVSSEVGGKGRYKLISDMGFMIELLPPQTTGVRTPGDTAGNLGAAEAWEIPMSENGRSSLIRREMLDSGMATMGTDANGWMLASDTTLTNGPATWYGSDEDSGTPGYDAGGPLPVELSHFRPARDKATGAVVITWSTQSELNNAGFFIKRSQQRDGQFQVINATMIAGAGTTSEKQSYTYTDSTAQPNVVYYYQIEDVSLDGQRQTLTNGIRLKGHIGAAGKATTLWGELKSSNE